jgi:hypothetical protein
MAKLRGKYRDVTVSDHSKFGFIRANDKGYACRVQAYISSGKVL